ncbi:hypothetical protein FisN_12Hh286 [Fistulifera solaris]|uniref:Uncharacterized protein n=1 Tax=Fistulifera solaris TaxID=1519565 RepID=A0A1Z5KBR9_FISSO|nr:hypothetical protein FisN_12Hh286 [Fistulifera solaris]|eukprot:GAX23709.1 hypothetical protein FisN_12Hh286 [Fistulifera solaris]
MMFTNKQPLALLQGRVAVEALLANTFTSMASLAKRLINRRLYRSLLESSKAFDDKSVASTTLRCLVHRTGFEDDEWDEVLRNPPITDSDTEDEDPIPEHHQLFRRLLREFISGKGTLGIRQMQFPSQCDSGIQLRDLIRREFRCTSVKGRDHTNEGSVAASSMYSEETRCEVAFLALREMNKKISWAERLRKGMIQRHPHQAAKHVHPLPLTPRAYLKPGTFLVAHPHMKGYFRRTVICLLDHQDGETDVSRQCQSPYGTYGLVINRICTSPQSNRNFTLHEVLKPLPNDLMMAFGNYPVKEGGPVNMSVQILYSVSDAEVADGCPSGKSNEEIGGHLLPMVLENEHESTAFHSDRSVHFGGDVLSAAKAVLAGQLDRDEISFFVGASCWAPGQLESEIERGFWLPCRGPPEIALSGVCQHEPSLKGQSRPKTDLWLSMLSACGEGEAELAHLLWSDDGEDEYSDACDDFY